MRRDTRGEFKEPIYRRMLWRGDTQILRVTVTSCPPTEQLQEENKPINKQQEEPRRGADRINFPICIDHKLNLLSFTVVHLSSTSTTWS